MTLFRQLLSAILAAMLLLYIGNIAVGLSNAKSLVEHQMRTHTEDTATFIALSMTQAAHSQDVPALNKTLRGVSDKGFYQRIYFRDIDDNLLIDRDFVGANHSAPQWFVGLLALPTYEGVAEVSSGWTKLGTLVVVSHPGHAYNDLWHLALEQFAWFAVVSAGVALLLWLAIGYLLAPLRALESQVASIGRQEFVEQPDIPRTRELANLVWAMNHMSLQLKSLFTSQLDLITNLRLQTHTDSLTGLSNRADFDARLNSIAGDDSGRHAAALMIFAVQELGEINQLGGRVEGNNILIALANCLKASLGDYPQAVVARRQGCEFAVLISDIPPEEAERLALGLHDAASQLSWLGQHEHPLVIHMGFTYSDSVSNGPELLSEADMVLRSFTQYKLSEWARFADIVGAEAPLVSISAIDWQAFCEQTIAERKIQLNIQAIFSATDREILAYEVFSRFPDASDGPGLASQIVMPAFERAGLAPELDQLVLTELCEKWRGRVHPLSVNICLSSLKSAEFHCWMDEFLEQNPLFAKLLTCEFSERMLRLAEHDIRLFEAILAGHGSGLAIDGFGLGTSGFGYLGSLPLRYLKVDRSFSRNIHAVKDNQFYIKALVQLAEAQALPIIAVGVESQVDWDSLISLGIAGGQGYLLGRPQLIHQLSQSTI
ncbi:MAG: EAL domain-containing protein [Gammaproteobacteria bacterium]|nr:EAL domain-containing protein [Gammaproteobacteria bacterium]MBQ0839962.1 EAL domain-containing protein [Gammaproteobacteria bacterium]